MIECIKLWCKTQPLKKVVEKYLLTELKKIISVVKLQKQKQFMFIIGKLSGQFIRKARQTGQLTCNFGMHSPILIFFSPPHLAINTSLSDS